MIKRFNKPEKIQCLDDESVIQPLRKLLEVPQPF